MFDVEAVRNDFPILRTSVYGHPLVYLDNAATTQVPECVLDTIAGHYHALNANVHRGIHYLSSSSTHRYEDARHKIAEFVNAPCDESIVFTRGTTDSLNMVALGLEHVIEPGQQIVVTMLEHHSNFVPWQQLAARTHARFVAAPLDANGDIDLGKLRELTGSNTRIVAASCCSNVLGTVTPVDEIVRIAHEAGALCVLDAAQVMRHRHIDVQALGCDFLAFSGHKMMGPTGIGVLYGRPGALDMLAPSAFGGEMVNLVSTAGTTFETAPLRFEAGTPNYVGAIALGRAVDYLESIGIDDIIAYEDELISYAEERLSIIDGLEIMGRPCRRSGCLSFSVNEVHPFDLCTMVDKLGIAIRSGNNCAQPLLKEVYGTPYVSRMSVAFYNTKQEIDLAATAIETSVAMLKRARAH